MSNKIKREYLKVRGQEHVHLTEKRTIDAETFYDYTTLCGVPLRRTALVTNSQVDCPECLKVKLWSDDKSIKDVP